MKLLEKIFPQKLWKLHNKSQSGKTLQLLRIMAILPWLLYRGRFAVTILCRSCFAKQSGRTLHGRGLTFALYSKEPLMKSPGTS